MSNILLAHNNRGDAGTFSNGTWDTTLVLNNLKDPDIDKVARSVGVTTTATMFAVDLGAVYTLRAVDLVNHNMTTAAAWQVKFGTVAPDASNNFASGLVLDSGVINVKQLTFNWDTPSDWGVQYNAMYVFGPISARYVTVTIADASNPAGYVQIGRFFVANGFQPKINPDYGLQDGRTDISTSVQADNGKLYFTKRTPRPRSVQFVLSNLSQAEGDQLHELEAATGITDEVLYVPDTADMAKSQRYGFVGTIKQLSVLDFPYPTLRSKAFEITQKL